MYPFSCVLWAIFWSFPLLVLRQIARYLPHHRSGNASKTHPKSSHDKFKTASQSEIKCEKTFVMLNEVKHLGCAHVDVYEILHVRSLR